MNTINKRSTSSQDKKNQEQTVGCSTRIHTNATWLVVALHLSAMVLIFSTISRFFTKFVLENLGNNFWASSLSKSEGEWYLPRLYNIQKNTISIKVEHNRDGDQPADHTGLNHGKPRGMGQKIDLIHSIHTQRIQIKSPVISISMADICDPFGGQLRYHLLPYQSISVGWAEKYKISFQLFE